MQVNMVINRLKAEAQKAVKTQKARGIVGMNSIAHHFSANSIKVLPEYGLFAVLKNDRDVSDFTEAGGIEALKAQGLGSIFARPCPTIPKHGFVESREVQTNDDLKTVWRETREADANGELILCSRVNASHNAVVTPNSITIGPGHDGATSGKETIMFPIAGALIPETVEEMPTHKFQPSGNYCTGSRSHGNHKFCLNCGLCENPSCHAFPNKLNGWTYNPHGTQPKTGRNVRELLGIKGTPYAEVVYNPEYELRVLTQLRDGPEIPPVKDLIPAETTVKEIIEVTEELAQSPTALLEWDKLISACEGKAGTVVYHAGGSPTSHFGVHCKLHNVPYLTTFRPNIGDTLRPNLTNEIDLKEVREGLLLGLSNEYGKSIKTDRDYKGMLKLALYTLHGFSVLGKAESKMLGVGIANMLRLATGACLGELRHFKGIRKIEGIKDRSQVYEKVITDLQSGLSRLRVARAIFNKGEWPKSYGGKNWANCTSLTILLNNAVVRFCKKPDNRKLQSVISALNKLVNAVHNGGLFLNKFAEQDAFNLAASNLAMFAMKDAVSLYRHARKIAYLEADPNTVELPKVLTRTSKTELAEISAILKAAKQTSDGTITTTKSENNRCGNPDCSVCYPKSNR